MDECSIKKLSHMYTNEKKWENDEWMNDVDKFRVHYKWTGLFHWLV